MKRPARAARPARGRGVTLARALSKLGVLSRTQAAAAIAQGRVAVGGRVVRDPARWVDPDRGTITLDGQPLRARTRIYLAMHKPPGVVVTRADERGRRTVYDLLPRGLPWVGPVGRLDRASSGLLLFTNDTRFAERITGGSMVAKVYAVTFDGPLRPEHVARMRAGMMLNDGTALRPVEVEPIAGAPARALLTLHEGKNRQIRRMAEACGLVVERLHRLAIGVVALGELAEGEVRRLTPQEIRRLAGPSPAD